MTLLSLLSALIAVQAAPALEALRWDKRVLVIFSADQAGAARQHAMLTDTAGMAERDLHLIEVVGDRVSGTSTPAAELRRLLKPAGPFAVILIGKDGGVKLRSAEPMSAARLFAVIDAMPMRAGEMQQR